MSEGPHRLAESYLDSPVVDRNGYRYFINPVSDGIPVMEPSLLKEIVDELISVSDLDCDVILAPEAMGIPLAVGISLETGIPYSVIRKRPYGLEGEIILDQKTGYSNSPMYINGLKHGDRVAIVDDVVSTGGTLMAITDALTAHGVIVTEACIVFNKSENIRSVSKEIGIPIRTLLDIGISENGEPFVRDAL